MQLKAESLTQALGRQLLPAYLVSGDETLLVEECCDAILKAARQAGFTERSVHHADGSFKWHELNHDSASMSLFAERKIIDLRLKTGKVDKDGSAAIREWLDGPGQSGEVMLLIRAPRLEPRQRNAAWFKALDGAGGITLIWPISPGQLPRWLAARMQQLDMRADRDAVQYLADRVEGNLLAAAQELNKLKLLDLPQPLSVESIAQSLDDVSRFTPFDLLDAMMAQQPQRVAHILKVLREEGVALFAITGAFVAQLRRLGQVQGLPPAKQKLMQAFAQRVGRADTLLAECAVIDQQDKGQYPGDAWLSLSRLLLRLSGVRDFPTPTEDLVRIRAGLR